MPSTMTQPDPRSTGLPRLSRSLPGLPAAAPIRLLHIGLGNFHRAHQAWYTANAPDASAWGIAALAGIVLLVGYLASRLEGQKNAV